MINDAGVTEADLQNLTWNPDDGGTYEKSIAHLTVDKNGKRGDEPGFDKTNVKVYGLGLDGGSGGGNGQTQWSMFTGTAGWQLHGQEPVGHPLQLRRPQVPEDHGLVRRPDRQGLHALASKRHRAQALGRHLRRRQVRHDHQRVLDDRPCTGATRASRPALAPTPIGPSGKRVQHVQRPGRLHLGRLQEQARRRQVGRVPRLRRLPGHRRLEGRRLPGHQDLDRQGRRRVQGQGRRRHAFTDQVKDKTTFLFPITDHASEIDGIMTPAMDAVFSGKTQPSP